MKRFLLFLPLICILLSPCVAQSRYEDDREEAYEEQESISPPDTPLPPEDAGQDNDDYEAYEGSDESSPVWQPVDTPLQQQSRPVSEEKWNEITNDEAFNYVPQKKEQPREPPDANALFSLVDFFLSTAGQIILVVLLVAIVVLVIVRIVMNKGISFINKKDKSIGMVDETSDDYVPEDWETVIQNAVRSGNLRLAVRHGYRYLLTLLSEKDLIKFQPAKTNYQYGYELAGSQWYQAFMQMTRQYEYAWYGGFDLQQEQFDRFYKQLSEIKNRLRY